MYSTARTVWLVGAGSGLARLERALVDRGAAIHRIASEDLVAGLRPGGTGPAALPGMVVLEHAVCRADGPAPLASLAGRAPWRLVPLVVVSDAEDEAGCRDAYAAGASSWTVVAPEGDDGVPAAFARYWLDTAMLPSLARPG